jgi:hypothetical protein
MMSARRLSLTTLVSLCALVGSLLAGSPAPAAVTHNYLSQIEAVPAKGPHGETVALPGPLGIVKGMTVDAGELYVADGYEPYEPARLDKFNATTGAFISQFPLVPAPVYDLRQSVAVGHSTGEAEVYETGDEHNAGGTQGRVAVYGPTGALQGLWTGADTPSGHFGCFECGARGTVAVDSSGNLLTKGRVYVSDVSNGVVDVFEALAGGGEKYLTQLTGPEPKVPFAGEIQEVAVNQLNGDVLVAEGRSTVDVFEPTALNTYALAQRLTGAPSGPFKVISGVTTDGGNGDIYVMENEGLLVDQFSSAGVYLGHLTGRGTPAGAFGGLTAMTVDPATHDVYVGDRSPRATFIDVFGPSIVVPDVTSESATGVKATSATLTGTVDPDEAGAATCRFEWGTSIAFGKLAPCEPEGVANGNGPVAVHAALSGLQPDTTYHFRLQASNANGTNPGEASQDQEFSTPGPGIREQSASIVTADSATLGAKIDPDGAATSYYFQYGTSTAYGTDLPAAPGLGLGAGKGDQAVSAHLQGLAAATTYHYRVVAIGEVGGEPVVNEGPDETFATQAIGSEITQPDGRAWEMVSPPDKQGSGIYAVGFEGGSDIQAAASGDGITYTANSPFVANPAGSRSLEMTQVISNRRAPDSWETADITTAHDEGPTTIGIGQTAEYKLFSSDLSLGLVAPDGDTPLPPLPAGSEKTIYFREADGAYKALVTSANVPPGTKFGGSGELYASFEFVYGTPDLSHVILSAQVALEAGAPAGGGLYEWSGGKLALVSVFPDGEPTSNATLGSDGGSTQGVVRHAISDDGSRVIWEQGGSGVYLRDTVRGETVKADVAQEGLPEVSGPSSFTTASSDGSRVFFTSGRHLTADSTLNSQSEDIYVFEVTSGSGEPLAGKVTDLSAASNRGEGAGVQGVIGASEDGSYVYFVARELLGDAAQRGAEGGHYLYVEHYDAATKAWAAPQLVAALSAEDGPTWASRGNLIQLTSRVSPDGRYLAFMSDRSLTGYENHDANSDVADEEVFLYDASTGKIVCASCNPSGGRPVGIEVGGLFDERLVDYRPIWGKRWLAGNVPGWTTKDLGSAIYQSRYLSDSGRLFFDSSDALVPADVNGREDVYEYEPDGIGSCQGPSHGQSASVVFDESVGGCIGLISSGTSSEESAFMDASETGGDVFFLTQSKLSERDYDTSLDMYDAHECTASEPCAPPAPLTPPPCTTGDACKPGPTPQPTLFGAPSSETFSGAGNVVPSAAEPKTVTTRAAGQAQKLKRALKACGKKAKRKRAGCERQARRKYGAKRSRVGKSVSTGTGR